MLRLHKIPRYSFTGRKIAATLAASDYRMIYIKPLRLTIIIDGKKKPDMKAAAKYYEALTVYRFPQEKDNA